MADDSYVKEIQVRNLTNTMIDVVNGMGPGGGGGPANWDTMINKPPTFAPIIGSLATQAVAGNDARLTNARTPTAHNHWAEDILQGVFVPARLGTGTANAGKVLFGDSTWKDAPTGGGTVPTKADIGLGNVDNTSDANKPISTATGDALNVVRTGNFWVWTASVTSYKWVGSGSPAHAYTMTGNTTFEFEPPPVGHAFVMTLKGAFTPTFPASVKWAGGAAPTYSAAGMLYQFVTLDAGVSWQGTGQAHG